MLYICWVRLFHVDLYLLILQCVYESIPRQYCHHLFWGHWVRMMHQRLHRLGKLWKRLTLLTCSALQLFPLLLGLEHTSEVPP
ncbi:hypothetical protein E2C01_012624 [Portunus trituberculatus]|uniref:Uncharacterized protein n=1 Tax=Portunus trituberculatus TaxID=210409 RepID=A0A5B7DEQ3_PORTR|nr:hypothetical protein [Portunus trituberculatus]